MTDKTHTLLCVLGESSSGKDSLVSKLCERTGHTAICSYTTRPKRDGEGATHIFVDDAVYETMLSESKIAAFTEISGFKYWTTTDQLYENSYYIIDYAGLQTLKSLNLPNLRIVSVYINVPEEIRKKRAQSRGDDMTVYRNRSLSERQQFRDMKKNMAVDYVIPNTELAKSVSVLKWICNVEGLFMNNTQEVSNDG